MCNRGLRRKKEDEAEKYFEKIIANLSQVWLKNYFSEIQETHKTPSRIHTHTIAEDSKITE